MAAVIRIKRSVGTAAPGSLKTGELAYSYGLGNENNLGDRLFFGKGDDGNGDATSVVVIGGEYFANMLDHAPGTLTARSAIITDSASRINNLVVDNIDIDANEISTTSGHLVLAPAADLYLNTSALTTNRIPYISDAQGKVTSSPFLTFDSSTLSIVGTLQADNIRIDGNTISSTDTNGNIVLDPNGSGVISASDTRIINAADPTSAQDVATKNYTDTQVAAIGTLNLAGDGPSSGNVSLADSSLTFSGSTHISAQVSDNTVSLGMNNSGVSAATYGSATLIPVLSVNQYGLIDSATSRAIATQLVVNGDATNDSISLLDSSLSILGGTGIETAIADTALTVTLSNTGVIASTYGSATAIPVITVNAQGQLTNVTTQAVATTMNVIGDTGTGSVDLLDSSLSITTGSGIVSTASANGFKLTLDSSAGVVFGTMEIVNGLTVGGDLQVNGTTVTVNTTTLEVTDNMIYLNAGESDGSPTQSIDVGFAANVNDNGSYEHVGFFRDATDNVWKLFQGYTPEPDSAPQIDTTHGSFAYAPLRVSSITGVYVGFDSDFSGKSTTDLTEGTNLYYTSSRADSDAKNAVAGGTGISYDPADGIISTNDGEIVHNALSGFIANEHVDHTEVTLTAGRGLTGGGDISASRSFSIDSAEFGDYFLSKQFLAGEGIDLTIDSDNKITITGELATATNLGVASFDSDQFTVSSGAVRISIIDGGTY